MFNQSNEAPSSSMMETSSGIFFDVVNPSIEMVNISDIAWSQSRQARFAGHTLSDNVYSVAQHSCYCTYLVDQALNVEPDIGYSIRFSLENWLEEKGYPVTSVMEAFRSDPFIMMKTLMHDSSEAYLVDLPTPVKRSEGIAEPYRKLEDNVMKIIYSSLEIDGPTPMEQEVIHWADLLALQVEAAHLLPSRGRNWSTEKPFADLTIFNTFSKVLTWKESYEAFLIVFADLQNKIAEHQREI